MRRIPVELDERGPVLLQRPHHTGRIISSEYNAIVVEWAPAGRIHGFDYRVEIRGDHGAWREQGQPRQWSVGCHVEPGRPRKRRAHAIVEGRLVTIHEQLCGLLEPPSCNVPGDGRPLLLSCGTCLEKGPPQ